jgi:predicted RNA binding protein YcfA (HicA-like mRNA interferase family)
LGGIGKGAKIDALIIACKLITNTPYSECNYGWYQVAQRGSHRQFKHPSKPGRVTVAGKPSDELAKGTQMSILKQAGLRGSDQP